MKKIVTFLSEHKHLFVVSFLTGLVVFSLQTAMQRISDLETEQRANIRLESVSVSVVSIGNDRPLETEPVVVLEKQQQDYFNTLGWVEDTSIHGTTPHVFEFGPLVPSFEGNTNQFNTDVRLPKNSNMQITLCEDKASSRISCQRYANNKFGLTLPINVVYTPLYTTEDFDFGKVTISMPQSIAQDNGVFTLAKPIILDIDPI